MREWYQIEFTPEHAMNPSKKFECVTDLVINGRLYRETELYDTLVTLKREAEKAVETMKNTSTVPVTYKQLEEKGMNAIIDLINTQLNTVKEKYYGE